MPRASIRLQMVAGVPTRFRISRKGPSSAGSGPSLRQIGKTSVPEVGIFGNIPAHGLASALIVIGLQREERRVIAGRPQITAAPSSSVSAMNIFTEIGRNGVLRLCTGAGPAQADPEFSAANHPENVERQIGGMPRSAPYTSALAGLPIASRRKRTGFVDGIGAQTNIGRSIFQKLAP